MTYFQIRIRPIGGGSSGALVVENFHPRWKEAAQRMLEGRIVGLMENYCKEISRWSQVPMSIEFTPEHGLQHIHVPLEAGLDLKVDQERYESHNISTVHQVGALAAVITEYISWLNFAIKDLPERRP